MSSMRHGLSEDNLYRLLAAWDDVSAAIDRVVTSLPGQLTEASNNLERQRAGMRIVINEVTRTSAAKEPTP